MPSYRIGFGSDFTLKNQKLGVGTDTASAELDIRGTTSFNDADLGVSTFSSYSGFSAQEYTNTDLVLGSDEYSTTGDIVVGIGSTFIVSVGATVHVGTVPSVSIGTHFSPPTGDINDRPEVPVEGTVRFNKDLNTLEFYNGAEWRQFTVSGASGRGIIGGGSGTAVKHLQTISYISIPTTGNPIEFGDLLQPVDGMGGVSSSIRAVMFGGTQNPGNPASQATVNTMQYVTIQSQGNSIDFGDLVGTHRYPGSATNGTRAIMFGGSGSPGYREEIETFNISTLGNSVDTGGVAQRTSLMEQVYSPTRAIFVSGYTPSSTLYNQGTVDNISKFMKYINITSTGSAVDFGEMYLRSGTGVSNNTRGVIGGGGNPYFPLNDLYHITIASLGKFEQFGDLIEAGSSRGNGNMSTQTRGVFIGGITPAPARVNTMEYVTFSSLGDGVMFGDLTTRCDSGASLTATSATSDSHGGLGGY